MEQFATYSFGLHFSIGHSGRTWQGPAIHEAPVVPILVFVVNEIFPYHIIVIGAPLSKSAQSLQ